MSALSRTFPHALAGAVLVAASLSIWPSATVAEPPTGLEATTPDTTEEERHAVKHLEGCWQNALARGNDISSERVPLPFPVNFSGNMENSLYVNNNGNVTFDRPLSAWMPFGLTSNIGTSIIAPFFADVDTRHPESNVVTYGSVPGGNYFCADWLYVGYADSKADHVIGAQLILYNRADLPGGQPGDFDIEFNYDWVDWESGDFSGGVGGLGGSTARAGYSAGTGLPGTSLELPGAGVPGAYLDYECRAPRCGTNETGLVNLLRNTTEPGRYIFPIRRGVTSYLGAISGTIYERLGDWIRTLEGALVHACPTSRLFPCVSTRAIRGGFYYINGLPGDGEYVVMAFSPAWSHAMPGSRGPIYISG